MRELAQHHGSRIVAVHANELLTGRSGGAPLLADEPLIAEAADDVDADLIVVGTHGRGGLTATLMGSVARALCHAAGRPVLVVPPARAKRRGAVDKQLTAV